MEEDDIYGDLPSFSLNNADENNSANFRLECTKLKNQVDILTDKLLETNNVNQKLEHNMASLLKTAKAEIARKDQMIQKLRKQLDNAAFRRKNFARNTNVTRYSPCKEVQMEDENMERLEFVEDEQFQRQRVYQKDALQRGASTVFGERLKRRLIEESEEEERKRVEELAVSNTVRASVEESSVSQHIATCSSKRMNEETIESRAKRPRVDNEDLKGKMVFDQQYDVAEQQNSWYDGSSRKLEPYRHADRRDVRMEKRSEKECDMRRRNFYAESRSGRAETTGYRQEENQRRREKSNTREMQWDRRREKYDRSERTERNRKAECKVRHEMGERNERCKIGLRNDRYELPERSEKYEIGDHNRRFEIDPPIGKYEKRERVQRIEKHEKSELKETYERNESTNSAHFSKERFDADHFSANLYDNGKGNDSDVDKRSNKNRNDKRCYKYANVKKNGNEKLCVRRSGSSEKNIRLEKIQMYRHRTHSPEISSSERRRHRSSSRETSIILQKYKSKGFDRISDVDKSRRFIPENHSNFQESKFETKNKSSEENKMHKHISEDCQILEKNKNVVLNRNFEKNKNPQLSPGDRADLEENKPVRICLENPINLQNSGGDRKNSVNHEQKSGFNYEQNCNSNEDEKPIIANGSQKGQHAIENIANLVKEEKIEPGKLFINSLGNTRDIETYKDIIKTEKHCNDQETKNYRIVSLDSERNEDRDKKTSVSNSDNYGNTDRLQVLGNIVIKTEKDNDDSLRGGPTSNPDISECQVPSTTKNNENCNVSHSLSERIVHEFVTTKSDAELRTSEELNNSLKEENIERIEEFIQNYSLTNAENVIMETKSQKDLVKSGNESILNALSNSDNCEQFPSNERFEGDGNSSSENEVSSYKKDQVINDISENKCLSPVTMNLHNCDIIQNVSNSDTLNSTIQEAGIVKEGKLNSDFIDRIIEKENGSQNVQKDINKENSSPNCEHEVTQQGSLDVKNSMVDINIVNDKLHKTVEGELCNAANKSVMYAELAVKSNGEDENSDIHKEDIQIIDSESKIRVVDCLDIAIEMEIKCDDETGNDTKKECDSLEYLRKGLLSDGECDNLKVKLCKSKTISDKNKNNSVESKGIALLSKDLSGHGEKEEKNSESALDLVCDMREKYVTLQGSSLRFDKMSNNEPESEIIIKTAGLKENNVEARNLEIRSTNNLSLNDTITEKDQVEPGSCGNITSIKIRDEKHELEIKPRKKSSSNITNIKITSQPDSKISNKRPSAKICELPKICKKLRRTSSDNSKNSKESKRNTVKVDDSINADNSNLYDNEKLTMKEAHISTDSLSVKNIHNDNVENNDCQLNVNLNLKDDSLENRPINNLVTLNTKFNSFLIDKEEHNNSAVKIIIDDSLVNNEQIDKSLVKDRKIIDSPNDSVDIKNFPFNNQQIANSSIIIEEIVNSTINDDNSEKLIIDDPSIHIVSVNNEKTGVLLVSNHLVGNSLIDNPEITPNKAKQIVILPSNNSQTDDAEIDDIQIRDDKIVKLPIDDSQSLNLPNKADKFTISPMPTQQASLSLIDNEQIERNSSQNQINKSLRTTVKIGPQISSTPIKNLEGGDLVSNKCATEYSPIQNLSTSKRFVSHLPINNPLISSPLKKDDLRVRAKKKVADKMEMESEVNSVEFLKVAEKSASAKTEKKLENVKVDKLKELKEMDEAEHLTNFDKLNKSRKREESENLKKSREMEVQGNTEVLNESKIQEKILNSNPEESKEKSAHSIVSSNKVQTVKIMDNTEMETDPVSTDTLEKFDALIDNSGKNDLSVNNSSSDRSSTDTTSSTNNSLTSNVSSNSSTDSSSSNTSKSNSSSNSSSGSNSSTSSTSIITPPIRNLSVNDASVIDLVVNDVPARKLLRNNSPTKGSLGKDFSKGLPPTPKKNSITRSCSLKDSFEKSSSGKGLQKNEHDLTKGMHKNSTQCLDKDLHQNPPKHLTVDSHSDSDKGLDKGLRNDSTKTLDEDSHKESNKGLRIDSSKSLHRRVHKKSIHDSHKDKAKDMQNLSCKDLKKSVSPTLQELKGENSKKIDGPLAKSDHTTLNQTDDLSLISEQLEKIHGDTSDSTNSIKVAGPLSYCESLKKINDCLTGSSKLTKIDDLSSNSPNSSKLNNLIPNPMKSMKINDLAYNLTKLDKINDFPSKRDSAESTKTCDLPSNLTKSHKTGDLPSNPKCTKLIRTNNISSKCKAIKSTKLDDCPSDSVISNNTENLLTKSNSRKVDGFPSKYKPTKSPKTNASLPLNTEKLNPATPQNKRSSFPSYSANKGNAPQDREQTKVIVSARRRKPVCLADTNASMTVIVNANNTLNNSVSNSSSESPLKPRACKMTRSYKDVFLK